MARVTIGQKAQRLLMLLMGLRHPRVASALSAHGFDEAELERGFAMLKRLTEGRLGVVLPSAPDSRDIDDLDRWENKWYPIIDAALVSNHPPVHEVVFRNLTQTSGPEVVVSVGTLLDRIDTIGEPVAEGGMGSEGRAARAFLIKRGVTDEVLGEARRLVTKIGTTIDTEIEPTIDRDADARAESELWAYYLEWSTIARTVIDDRRLLRVMGFLKSTEEIAIEPEEPEAPIGGDQA